MTFVLTLLVVCAALAAPAARRLGTRTAAWVLALPMVAAFALLAAHTSAVVSGDVPREVLATVAPLDVELALRLDGLGLLFSLLVAGIGALVLVHAAGYLADKPRVLGRFAALATLFAAAMIGLVLADDLFLLFVFWELTSIASFLLIGLKHEESAAREGASRALLVTGAGGIALLVGLLLLASAAGTTSIGELLERGERVRSSALYLPALLLVLAGALTKSAQVPFHYWLPGAMAAPSPVSAFLHSATLVKAGVYLLARLHPVLGFRPEWHVLLGHVGAVTMLVGAVLAFAQEDLKRLLAYTTVAGLGTLVLLLGIGTEPALRAAILFLTVHALYKAALFMVVGYLDQRTGTREAGRLSGLARAAPLAFAAAALSALSMSGLPPLLGAIAKELVYEAKLGAPEAPVALAAIGTLANALVVGCAALVGIAPFLGRAGAVAVRPVGAGRLLLGPVVLAAASLVLGLTHGTLAAPLVDAALAATGGEPVTAAFRLDAAPGAVDLLGKATVAAGLLAFLARRRLLVLGRPLAALARVGPAALHGRLLSALFSVAGLVASASERRVVRTSLVASLVLLLAAAGAPLLAGGLPAWPSSGSGLAPHEAFVALVVVGGAWTVVRARATLPAVAALGAAGLGVGLLFLSRGGPDLALTQIAVETLAALLLLSVLRRHPLEHAGSERETRGSPLLDAVLALAVGAVFALLVWAAAPDGGLRPLAAELSAASQPRGHGRNVVNVILVDVRALDTLGEVFVLAIAALGVAALLRRSPGALPLRPPSGAAHATPMMRAAARTLVPLLVLLSLVLFVRGHHEPGGGFVGGLVAASAAMLHAFAFGVDATCRRLAPARLAALGLAVALAAGTVGLFAGGTFLSPTWLPAPVPAVGKLGTPLLFDAGVYLVVLGVATRVLLDLFAEGEVA